MCVKISTKRDIDVVKINKRKFIFIFWYIDILLEISSGKETDIKHCMTALQTSLMTFYKNFD